MYQVKPLLLISITLFTSGLVYAADDVLDSARSNTQQNVSPALDVIEASHLTFMREEEKLARDVYLSFAQKYPTMKIFSNIGSGSEQKHTDTMRDKLSQYNLPDPNPVANDLPDSIGEFHGEEWGWYFAEKYQQLTTKGFNSKLAALYVGAFIEELDMNDIAICPQIMIDKGYPARCGLDYTDEHALKNTYNALIDGSKNHLRAFVGQIEKVIGAGNYKAQYLTQAEVDDILMR